MKSVDKWKDIILQNWPRHVIILGEFLEGCNSSNIKATMTAEAENVSEY